MNRRLTPGQFILIAFTSGLGSGFAPFASGTWGTGVAMLLYLPIARFNRLPSHGGNLWIYAAIVAAVAILGSWASNFAEKYHGKKDPGQIVIDEIAGYFITMFLLPFDWKWMLAGFFVFRVFDVVKPPPAYKLQSLKGGAGVMVDDLLAGAYSCLVLQAARWALGA